MRNALVLVLLVGLVLGSLSVLQPAPNAALAALPTPISMSDRTDATDNVTFWNSKPITSSQGSTVAELPGAEVLDLQYVIDETIANSTTLKLQYSNDNSHWTDGPTVVATVQADANGLDQYANFGRYTRLYATLVGSDPVTLTALAVAK